MADGGKDAEELPTRGNEWEVVSLTASAFAAAPSDGQADPAPDKDEEAVRAMFLSGHFVFPPSEHENLPIEPDSGEIYEIACEEDIDPRKASGDEPQIEEDDRLAKSQQEWNIKGHSETDDGHGVQLFGEKIISRGTKVEEGKVQQGLGLLAEEENMNYGTHFRSFCDEAESSVMFEPGEHLEQNIDSCGHFSESPKSSKEDEVGEVGIPCEVWWKRHLASLYAHVKETNAFWSVVFAAALMGLVVLGQRWQQERWQHQQLIWQFGVNNEKTNRVLGPISRFRDILGGQRQRRS